MKTYVYPAVLYQDKEGANYLSIPDLNLLATGMDAEEAFVSGKEYIKSYFDLATWGKKQLLSNIYRTPVSCDMFSVSHWDLSKYLGVEPFQPLMLLLCPNIFTVILHISGMFTSIL